MTILGFPFTFNTDQDTHGVTDYLFLLIICILVMWIVAVGMALPTVITSRRPVCNGGVNICFVRMVLIMTN